MSIVRRLFTLTPLLGAAATLPVPGTLSPGLVRKEDTTCLEETKEIKETEETKEKARP